MRAASLLILACVLASASAFPREAWASLSGTTLIGCGGAGSSEILFSYQGSFSLDRAFLQESEVEGAIQEAIELQTRYIGGFFQNDPEYLSNVRVALGAYRAPVEILSRKTGTYGMSLKIDPFRKSKMPPHSYVDRAIARGMTRPDDPSLEVTFRTRIKLAFCNTSARLAGTRPASAVVPKDPYLALWYVPPDKRRAMEYGLRHEIVNPCTNSEMAQFGHALQFWYLWNPRLKGTDEKGEQFDCPGLVPAGVYTTSVSLAPVSEELGAAEFRDIATRLPKKEPVRMTLIFGTLVPDDQMAAHVGRLRDLLASGASAQKKTGDEFWSSWFGVSQETRLGLPEPTFGYFGGWYPETDYGWMELLTFLRYVPEVLSVDRIEPPEARFTGESIVFTIHGRLKSSGHRLTARIFYGPTTALRGSRKPQHWPVLFDALARDQVILYNGHAALGSTFSLAGLENGLKIDEAKLADRLAAQPYQLFGVLSCYSYTYYGEDIAKLRPHGLTDFLLSGTKDAGSKFVLRLLGELDHGFSKLGVNWDSALSPFLSRADYFVLKRFGSAAL
jgi:hypothetical protein